MNGDPDNEHRLSFLQLLALLGEQKLLLMLTTLVFTLSGIAWAMLAKPVFTSTATVLTPKSSGGGANAAAAAMLSGAAGGQLASLAGAAGIGGGDEFYPTLLRSASTRQWVVEHLKLQERRSLPSTEAARDALMGALEASVDRKSGLMTVVAHAGSATEAAELANAAVEGLKATLGRLAVTEAQSRRVFFERELEKAQKALTTAEQAFLASRSASGLQSFTGLAEAGLRSSIELRAQMNAREMELQGIRQFAGPQHPDVLRLMHEIRTLQAELRRVETGQAPAQRLTAQHAQALKNFRDMKMQEALAEGYARQVAAAQFDEAREGPLVQVVDAAEPPKLRSKPERRKIVMIAAGLGLLLGLVLALIRAFARHAGTHPETRQQWRAAVSAWTGLKPSA